MGSTGSLKKTMMNQARFEDGLVRGDWFIDVHSQSKGLFHQKGYEHGDYYEIPYRSLINPQVSNLLTVGRCISTTFLMQASVRITPTVIDMGDAAGFAPVLCRSQRTHRSLSCQEQRFVLMPMRSHLCPEGAVPIST